MPFFGRKPPDTLDSAKTPRQIAAAFGNASGRKTIGATLSGMAGRTSTHSKVQAALNAASRSTDPAVQRGLLRQAHSHASEWMARRGGAADAQGQRASSMRSLMTSLERHEEAHRGYYAGGMISTGPTTELGSGRVNTVHKATFANGGSEYAPGHAPGTHVERDKSWVFKASGETEQGAGSHIPLEQLGGVRLEHADLTERNVLVSKVADSLGTSVIPETRKAIAEGSVGSAMEFAPGQSPLYEAKKHFDSDVSAELDMMSPEEIMPGAKRDSKGWYQDMPKFRAHDYEGATSASGRPVVSRTQRDLLDLQAVDYVTNAGADRHQGNVYYDAKTGGVQGIDNDYAFGTMVNHPENHAKMQGLPPMLHASTASRITAMDSTAFSKTVESLPAEERDAAVQRLSVLKQNVATIRETDGIRGGLMPKGGAASHDLGGSVKERAKRFEARAEFNAATYKRLTNSSAPPSYLRGLHQATHDPATRGDEGYSRKK